MDSKDSSIADIESRLLNTLGLERVQTLLALACRLRGTDLARAITLAGEARDLAATRDGATREDESAWRAAHVEALLEFSMCCSDGSRPGEAEAAADEVLRVVGDTGAIETRAHALLAKGISRLMAGSYESAGGTLEEAAELLVDLRPRGVLLIRTWNCLGISRFRRGLLSDALNIYRDALALATRTGERKLEIKIRANIAHVKADLGDLGGALESYLSVVSLLREDGDLVGLGRALHNLASLHADMGAYEDGSRYAREALRLARETGDRKIEAMCQSQLSGAAHDRGDYAAAVAHAEKAVALGAEIGSGRVDASGLLALGRAQSALGDNVAALESCERSVAQTRRHGWVQGEYWALIDRARIHLEQGEFRRAIATLEGTMDSPEFKGLEADAPRVAGILARAYEGMGDLPRAIEELRRQRELEASQRRRESRVRLEHVRATHDLDLARARADSAERRGQARLSVILENTPNVAFHAYDADGRIVLWNSAAEAIFGWTEAEARGLTAGEVYLDEESARRFGEALASVRQTGAPIEPAEGRFHRKDGSRGTALTTLFAITDEDEETLVVRMDVDITQRKSLEEQLRQGQKMEAIGRLAAGVAHDFNNLLTTISGYSELLHTSLGDGHPGIRCAKEIGKASVRAAGLTRQLLAFSRKQARRPQALEMNTIVANLEGMLSPLIGEDIDLRLELSPEPASIHADPTQVEQILVNLVVNARDAMPTGGMVRISTEVVEITPETPRDPVDAEPGFYVRLSVEDTGSGVDENIQAQIFEPFFTTKPKGEGTGLGLSTVYGIVQQTGGFVTIESAPGEGAIFRVHVPRLHGEVIEELEDARSTRSVQGSETILVVEDDDQVRRLTEEVLQGAGYRVLSMSSGDEALEVVAAHEGEIHLLLTDIVLAGESGPALAKRLQDIQPEIRVLFMTGYSAEMIARRGESTGERQMIEKPFKPASLLDSVQKVLAMA